MMPSEIHTKALEEIEQYYSNNPSKCYLCKKRNGNPKDPQLVSVYGSLSNPSKGFYVFLPKCKMCYIKGYLFIACIVMLVIGVLTSLVLGVFNFLDGTGKEGLFFALAAGATIPLLILSILGFSTTITKRRYPFVLQRLFKNEWSASKPLVIEDNRPIERIEEIDLQGSHKYLISMNDDLPRESIKDGQTIKIVFKSYPFASRSQHTIESVGLTTRNYTTTTTTSFDYNKGMLHEFVYKEGSGKYCFAAEYAAIARKDRGVDDDHEPIYIKCLVEGKPYVNQVVNR